MQEKTDKTQEKRQTKDKERPQVARVERHLTEMKELPTKTKDEEVKTKESKDQEKLMSTRVDKSTQETVKPLPTQAEGKPSEIQLESEEDEKKGRHNFYSVKDAILLVINVISIILLLVILFRLPDKAAELKRLRVEKIRNESNISIEFPEIKSSKQKADELDKLFVDDSGIVDFVKHVEEIKAAGGVVNRLNFASQKAIKDRSENFGIPVVIELKGSWEQINTDIKKIQSTPYLFRAVKIDIEKVSEEEENFVKFEYGGFLYVVDKLGES